MSQLTLKSIAMTVAFVASLSLMAQGQELTHAKDSVATVKKNLNDGKAVLLDVREQSEWDAGHLAAARHFALSDFQDEAKLASLVKTLDKKKIIYTHCKAGGRALTCGEMLKKEGFDVRPLKPGYQQLLEGGFEKGK